MVEIVRKNVVKDAIGRVLGFCQRGSCGKSIKDPEHGVLVEVPSGAFVCCRDCWDGVFSRGIRRMIDQNPELGSKIEVWAGTGAELIGKTVPS